MTCEIRGCAQTAWKVCPECERAICYPHSTLNRGEIRCRTCIAKFQPTTEASASAPTSIPESDLTAPLANDEQGGGPAR